MSHMNLRFRSLSFCVEEMGTLVPSLPQNLNMNNEYFCI